MVERIRETGSTKLQYYIRTIAQFLDSGPKVLAGMVIGHQQTQKLNLIFIIHVQACLPNPIGMCLVVHIVSV